MSPPYNQTKYEELVRSPTMKSYWSLRKATVEEACDARVNYAVGRANGDADGVQDPRYEQVGGANK